MRALYAREASNAVGILKHVCLAAAASTFESMGSGCCQDAHGQALDSYTRRIEKFNSMGCRAECSALDTCAGYAFVRSGGTDHGCELYGSDLLKSELMPGWTADGGHDGAGPIGGAHTGGTRGGGPCNYHECARKVGFAG